MSSSGDKGAEIAQTRAFGRLETAVSRLLEERRATVERARQAEQKLGELEARLKAVESDGGNPVELRETIARLEAKNAELVDRLGRGREGVDRLLSRIRFLKGQRDG